jgi:hypothetical protein
MHRYKNNNASLADRIKDTKMVLEQQVTYSLIKRSAVA